ncbi:unnamed protein product [Candidula unifasciata]|uniref:Uncharacterized protein n=1 Tax=Candidula unifasciata TaxID=100452 RepID=A0A8S3ZD39_9EUPU|nr:unnamed protein product [Candidula unifasciata]
MTSSTSLIKIALTVLCVECLISAVACDRFTLDLTVRYFTDVSMVCDHPELEISQQIDVRSMAWILPDDAYNLTVMDVSDDVFGYYTCIVVYDLQTKPLDVIRWSINMDGADFSELMQTYQDNAIVGGIAAGAMLVAIGAVILLWHFRYSNAIEPCRWTWRRS